MAKHRIEDYKAKEVELKGIKSWLEEHKPELHDHEEVLRVRSHIRDFFKGPTNGLAVDRFLPIIFQLASTTAAGGDRSDDIWVADCTPDSFKEKHRAATIFLQESNIDIGLRIDLEKKLAPWHEKPHFIADSTKVRELKADILKSPKAFLAKLEKSWDEADKAAARESNDRPRYLPDPATNAGISSTLSRLKAWVLFIDDVDAAFAAHDAAVLITLFGGFERA